MLPFLIATVFIAALAAYTDFKTGTIPNWLTVGGMLGGIGGHVVLGMAGGNWQTGLHEGAASFAGLLFCALAPFILFYKGGMGGGDVKLFAAIGALCQPLLGIEMQMYALALAAVLAPLRLAYQGQLLRVLAGSFALLANPFRPAAERRSPPAEAMTWFRLGPVIFASTLVTLALHTIQL
jgi:prepilin peptidase CpaA